MKCQGRVTLYREKVYLVHSSRKFKSLGTCISSVLVRVADGATGHFLMGLPVCGLDSGKTKNGSGVWQCLFETYTQMTWRPPTRPRLPRVPPCGPTIQLQWILSTTQMNGSQESQTRRLPRVTTRVKTKGSGEFTGGDHRNAGCKSSMGTF